MASPFARSLRSIEADKFNLSIITAGIAVVVVVLWSLWFFFSQITIYVDSYEFNIDRNGYVQTVIPANQAKNVKQGQPAIILFDGELGEELGVVNAIVYEVRRSAQSSDVALYTPSHYQQLDMLANAEPPSGTVRIQVETASPAAIILHSIGRTSDQPSLISGPQS